MKSIKLFTAIYKNFTRDLYTLLFSDEIFYPSGSRNVAEQASVLIDRLTLTAFKWADKFIPTAFDEAKSTAERILEKELFRAKQVDLGRFAVEGGVAEFKRKILYVNDSIKANVEEFLIFALTVEASIGIQMKMPSAVRIGIGKLIRGQIESEELSSGIKVTQGIYTIKKSVLEYMKKNLGEVSFISIVGKDGIARNYNMWKYAEMVSRTTIMGTMADATLQSCKERDNDLVMVSTHTDPCPICEVYQGQIYSISGTDPEYPALNISLPAHPNCKHGFRPVSNISIKYLRKEKRLPRQRKDHPTVEERKEQLRTERRAG